VRRTPVQSSSLAAVGYSPDLNVLEVEFRNGLAYEYRLVPESVHRQLMEAESKGAFLNAHIRNRYPTRRL